LPPNRNIFVFLNGLSPPGLILILVSGAAPPLPLRDSCCDFIPAAYAFFSASTSAFAAAILFLRASSSAFCAALIRARRSLFAFVSLLTGASGISMGFTSE